MTSPLDRQVLLDAADLIDIPGRWIQESMIVGERCCAHGAVLQQHCTPGDEHLWRPVMRHMGLTEAWNDDPFRIASDVSWALRQIEATEADMEDVYGPQWLQVRHLVRHLASLTAEEVVGLVEAWCFSERLDFGVVRDQAFAVTQASNRTTAYRNALAAAESAVQSAANVTIYNGSCHAVRAVVVSDLIDDENYRMLVTPLFEALNPTGEQ